MAVSLDKYGNLVDSVSGKYVGLARGGNESDASYVARGNNMMASNADSWANSTDPVRQAQALEYGAPQQPKIDIQAEIQKLKQAQIDQSVANLGKSRDSQLSNLNAEKAQIAPTYYGKRNAASTQSQLGARNFAEFMAGRGGTTAGSNAQVELSRLGNLEGQLGSLNRDEAGANMENSRRVTDVNNAYASDVAAAQAGAEATALQNTINQMNADRAYQQAADQFAKNFGLQEAGVTGKYNGADTLASLAQKQSADQFAKQFGLQEGQLLGTYNGQKTLPYQQYLTGIDQWQKEYDANQSQRDFEQWLAKQQLALSQQNAARASSGSSSANLSALKYQNEIGSQQSLAQSMQGLQQMASNGATRSDILKFINSNAGDLQANNVPVQDLYNWAAKNFTWDKNSSGEWYDTSAK